MKKIFKILIALIAILLLIIIGIIISNRLKTPQLDRDWTEDAKILPAISINESIVTISNIRDWRYETQEVVSKEYYTDVFDISKITQTYLLFNPFGKWEGVGHFWFVFEFENSQTVSISVEARREEGEGYSAVRGLFNVYELWYSIGSAQDHVTRRTVYNSEDVYLYPLLISKESSRSLFMEMVEAAQKIETQAQFYNTVSSNCTNILAGAANRVKKGSIPFHKSRLFTGYADNQLYDLKYIPHDKPFEQIYKEAHINDLIDYSIIYSEEEFWQNLIK